MSRPKNYSIDYFSFNVDFFDDPKLLFVASRFQEKGELIVVKLLCWIYKTNGYYTEWNDEIAMLFAKRAFVNIKYTLVNDVVNELIKRDFFAEDMFNSFGILTSSGIQKRWIEATKRRKLEINKSYFCIKNDTESTVNDTESTVNDTESTVNDTETQQSKVKESKVKESRESLSRTPAHEGKAFYFLKIINPERFEQEFQMRYSSKITDKKKFVEDFNDTVDLEEIEFTQKKLFARLSKYARNWIENQNKFKKPNEDNNTYPVPIG